MTKQASLNGALSVSLINGYTPPQGDSYQVLAFASETGNFSAEFGLYFGNGEGFTPTFNPSTNPTALDLVVAAQSLGTQTTVQSSENPSNYGDSVTFTATVQPPSSTSLVPSGQVTFYDGATALDTETLVNGSATLHHVHPHRRGALDRRAVRRRRQLQRQQFQYPHPDGQADRQPGVRPVVREPVGLWRFRHLHGDGLARVLASSLATPTGQVTFYDGTTVAGHRNLERRLGQLHHVDPDLGSHPISVQYGGDTNYFADHLEHRHPDGERAARGDARWRGLQRPQRQRDSPVRRGPLGLDHRPYERAHHGRHRQRPTPAATTPSPTSSPAPIRSPSPSSRATSRPCRPRAPSPVTAASGQTINNLNFGEFQTVTLSGEVYRDINDRRLLDGSESGLSGWTVNLLNSSQQIVQTVKTTDAQRRLLLHRRWAGVVHGRGVAPIRLRADELAGQLLRDDQQRSERTGLRLRHLPGMHPSAASCSRTAIRTGSSTTASRVSPAGPSIS